ncbi:UDP-2,4-diacetamido-2,4,6-trideoxy-beta-L-altropyranose hydrolase [Legionella pneumophila]|uniref:UDP-2,4-diacetamido-2,4, 6-trideoxy-beta-L-altropyranose hydrolase n=1 Tax=Legionella pneumophila TaxID=446 RepID=UPI001A250DCF|nr:UDP-2,4-diacetamido-2,4,6-trideoxy-beta-L-altropyranose hydrolase [Legionella pneumophila]MCW8388712.1 UDP-2,4-diacetamido-2,4,6-trideoxy-beta-L-altropyranose hydrolase [Legionella pneumophila]HAT1800162.1 UDP-2,4-diacetamido-2,4,6-trideoxy-beta-L-altropyranose hydrolase [Legionella pneumophila]HCJ1067514.1 UDP-2,4-diacetamido-2,4,6-trideoxy-beta-L-altropyranose hydrolase [Legionella pneumophila]HCJ4411119.1 UDP-2,4-diacetamido-2,4,6-trideoxy-beta-L-altropyranose hydrolase [Legionella pneumo
MKISFRVDASENIGIGHLKRCQVLAKQFIKKGSEVTFFSTRETQQFLPVNSNDIQYQFIEDFWSTSFLQQALNSDLFIIDHYELGIEFEQEISQKLDANILVIDDFNHRPHHCNYFLNQNYGFTLESYKGLIPEFCKLFLGPTYALLDEIYSQCRQDKFFPGNKVENILINFGGTDPYHLCTFAFEAIRDLGYKSGIDIVLGHSSQQKKVLERLIQNTTPQIMIHDYIPLAPLISKSDLIIGAGGSSCWERACLGKPSIIISTSSDQVLVAESLDNVSALIYLGHYDMIDKQKLANVISKISNNHRLRNLIAANAHKLCDGLGAQRLVEEIYAGH